MLPEKSVLRMAGKEVSQFFSSPVAFVFLAAFLAVNLFIFFWVEAFFARNIADVRPLFEWMPLLLIFLVAALTMRMWSDEKRMGTIEFLMTLPVTPLQLVLGKFIACFILLLIALALTLPIPFTVSYLGHLDWGPVIGAYVATLCLGAAYLAIGLYVSAKNESQIVSLIVTVLVCSLLYLLGSDTLVDLFGYSTGEVLKQLGTGSRFESITRGIIDVRDLYYYLSLVGVFLALNVLALEKQRWSSSHGARSNHRAWYAVSGLMIANLFAANLWLSEVKTLRADLTDGNLYSINDATRDYLNQLQEPLLIRGYFSAKTHPLLAPLVPQLRNLIKEYEVAGGDKVRVEFVDPQSNPELEDEANNKYSIRPVPFQVSDKYQASLVNSYFNVLISYGDQFEVLGFRDLIEVKDRNESDLDVRLRNPEYDITKAIKKVLYAYQSQGDLFATINTPVKLNGYVSSTQQLPKELQTLAQELNDVLAEIKQESSGKFSYELQDPNAGDGSLAQKIQQDFGMQPMATSLLSNDRFYFYLLMNDSKQYVQIALPDSLDKDGLKRNIESGLKRFSAGFTKTLALVVPESDANPYMQQLGQQTSPSFKTLRDKLMETMTVKTVDLKDGLVPEDADILMLAAPESLSDKQLFAVDQFLMKGGTVLLSTSPYQTRMTSNSLTAGKHTSGLETWLQNYGINLAQSMVLDPQNASFPIPVTRNVGGMSFREIRLLDYPYFADIRDTGMNQDSAITSGLPNVTMSWASPIELDKEKTKSLQITELLHSSPQSWVSDKLDVTPRVSSDGRVSPWTSEGEPESYLVGVALEGRFESSFKGKESPLLGKADDAQKADQTSTDGDKAGQKEDKAEKTHFGGVIDKSPESARIILFSSNEFLNDQTISLISSTERAPYLNSMQLVQNAVDWSLEDRSLLQIRSRSHFANTLYPMSAERQQFWEYLNYGLAIAGLALLYALFRLWFNRRQSYYAGMLELGRA
ncbi:Gldg family protein [Hahella sp. CR1]|uniref:Gldg family protein n=1 Tax=Hahella sp. CR1 TaxID=2992807 RepID=UPI0024425261|nr:Gldg family protein [Hahella sp. CR1]MDG9667581.1 Gldg family protein [Hahella sp. CR1]